MRRWGELDLNCLLVGIDVVPLSKCVPAFSNDLYLNPSLGNLGNFRRTVLVRLEIQLSQFVVVEEATGFIESDIDAGISNRLSVGRRYNLDFQFYRGGLGRLFILFVGLVRRGLLVLGSRLILSRRLLLISRLSVRRGGNAQECRKHCQR